jgi:hypothetical protein
MPPKKSLTNINEKSLRASGKQERRNGISHYEEGTT